MLPRWVPQCSHSIMIHISFFGSMMIYIKRWNQRQNVWHLHLSCVPSPCWLQFCKKVWGAAKHGLANLASFNALDRSCARASKLYQTRRLPAATGAASMSGCWWKCCCQGFSHGSANRVFPSSSSHHHRAIGRHPYFIVHELQLQGSSGPV